MDEIFDYDKKMDETREKNAFYLEKFEDWLKGKGLSSKTINSHINNVEFYINDFVNYYEFNEMEQGCFMIDDFLGDFFIRKCMWSTPYTTKQNAASIKKFYSCMKELGYIKKESYDFLNEEIKENMEYWIESMDEYNSFDDSDFL